MSNYALWIDHEHAFVFKFGADGIEETKFHASGKESESYEKFFHEIAQKLTDPEELMLMGPGVAKAQFKHHCEKHHHPQLAKSIIGVATMESHPTKAMMLEKAGDFFKNYHLWKKNY